MNCKLFLFICVLYCYCTINNSECQRLGNYISLLTDLRTKTCKEPYNIDLSNITVSGISSGAYMAIQMHIAHSASIKGVAAIAGGPYWSLISVSELWAATTYAYSLASIDSPSNLKSSKVWLFSGTQDTVVDPGVVKKAVQYYQGYMDSSSIKFVNSIPSEHAWITNNYGSACNYLGVPYINNCGFDAAGDLLQFFFGPLKNASTAPSANLQSFEQSYYTPLKVDPSTISLNKKGWIYVPTKCQDHKTLCKLHVSFHGCHMGFSELGNIYIVHSGLNEWAEANNIIILYPQAIATQVIPYNPQGCWDWWGYSGADYATKIGPQILTISNMISAITGS